MSLLALCVAQGDVDWVRAIEPLAQTDVEAGHWILAVEQAIAQRRSPSAASALLSKRPQLGAFQDHMGANALILAARSGDPEWVQQMARLCDQGAITFAGYDAVATGVFFRRDPADYAPLFPAWTQRPPSPIHVDALAMAFAHDQPAWAKALLPWREPGWHDREGFGAAHACALGNCAWGPALLSPQDFEVRAGKARHSALHSALGMEHRAAFLALLPRSDLLAADAQGKTVLDWARESPIAAPWGELLARELARRERQAMDDCAGPGAAGLLPRL